MSQDASNPVQQNAETEVNPMYEAGEGQEASSAEAALEPAAPKQPSPYEEADREFASKFAALSRKEKEFRELQQTLEAEKASIEEMKAKYQTETNLMEQLKYNPLKALEEHGGYKFEDLTKFAMNGGEVTPEMQMKLMRKELEEKFSGEINSLRSQQEESKRVEAEQQQEAAKNNFMEEIKSTVAEARDEAQNPKYEFIAANDASDMVYDVIEQHYQESGKILDVEEAAEEVERYLEDEAKKLLKLNKFSKYLQPKVESKAPESAGTGSPTLSNDLASQSPRTSTKLSRDQSLAEAAKLLQWND